MEVAAVPATGHVLIENSTLVVAKKSVNLSLVKAGFVPSLFFLHLIVEI